MRVVMLAALIAASPAPSAWSQTATWRGSEIASTADPIPVRDLRGRDVKHRDYRRGENPNRRPPRPHKPDRGIWIGPSVTVGAGDYLPRERSARQEQSQCLAAPSGPPSASSAINSAAAADGRQCEAGDR